MRGHPLSGRLPATPTEVSEQIPPLVLSAPGRGLTLNRSRHCFSLSLATETARAILNILTKSYKPTFSSKETANCQRNPKESSLAFKARFTRRLRARFGLRLCSFAKHFLHGRGCCGRFVSSSEVSESSLLSKFFWNAFQPMLSAIGSAIG